MSLELIGKRLENLEGKIDKIVDIQADIRIDLNEHIRRTEIAEKRLDHIDIELRPIGDHVKLMQIAGKVSLKIIAAAATATGLAFGAVEIVLKVIGK